MENEQQPNAEKDHEEMARKTSGEGDSMLLPEARAGDQSLQELTSLVSFFKLCFWKRSEI